MVILNKKLSFMNNLDKELENQIGDFGADESNIGKKLRHKASYGQKEDLNEDEKQDLASFVSRSNRKSVMIENEQDDINVYDGWLPIDRSEMGERSKFYPAEWDFYIKPASVQAIKNWTSIDEERLDVLNKVFTEIIKTCVRIDTHSEQGASWAQINSWDRFWFILKIREYTFAKGESKVEFEDECSECGENITYTLNSKGLFYEFPDKELVDKFWNGEYWEIDPREFNVDHDVIKLYTPKLGKDSAIIEWATARVQNKQKYDETFIKFLIWMLNKPSRDAQKLNLQIQSLEKEYKSWSVDMFVFMEDVINNITINQSERLRCKCPYCSQEATSEVQFPNGIKRLFIGETRVKKFGSR